VASITTKKVHSRVDNNNVRWWNLAAMPSCPGGGENGIKNGLGRFLIALWRFESFPYSKWENERSEKVREMVILVATPRLRITLEAALLLVSIQRENFENQHNKHLCFLCTFVFKKTQLLTSPPGPLSNWEGEARHTCAMSKCRSVSRLPLSIGGEVYP
jgi:hypothetical protein